MRTSLEQRQLARQAGEHSAFLEADIAFHLAIATASKNAVLTELYQTFATALREGLVKLDADAELGRADQAVPHEQLFAAITAGDADSESCPLFLAQSFISYTKNHSLKLSGGGNLANLGKSGFM